MNKYDYDGIENFIVFETSQAVIKRLFDNYINQGDRSLRVFFIPAPVAKNLLRLGLIKFIGPGKCELTELAIACYVDNCRIIIPIED